MTTTAESAQAKRERLRGLLEATRPATSTRHPFDEFVNPGVGTMLRGLGIDVEFVSGSGTSLFDAQGRRYLDFAGAYGALPFGHNPGQIWEAISSVQRAGEPSLVQPSLLGAGGDLGRCLVDISPAGIERAWLCNSGAEAVEAAIKLVRAHHPTRSLIVAADNGFHGKTLGALSLTGRGRYQEPFGAPVAGFVHVPFGDLEAMRALFAQRGSDIAAVMVEPIQGEGGVVPAPAGYLTGLRELCDHDDALLVLDEVQTGLGRTGAMFAAEHEGVRADVITVAKALGGGIVPIGAVLFTRQVQSEAFDQRHTSTFGANALCARVGIASIDLLVRDDFALLAHVRQRGEQLAEGLGDLVRRHDRVCEDARGRGLLWGLELTDRADRFPNQGLLRSLADAEALAGIACGYLLAEHGVRVAPTFFSGRVLRIEPPLTVTESQVDQVLDALDDTLGLMSQGRSGSLVRHLVPAAGSPGATAGASVGHTRGPDTTCAGPALPQEVRWAFLAHPTDLASYASFDPSLGMAGEDVRVLFDRLNMCRNAESPAGMLMGSCRVHVEGGDSTFGEVFALAHDAAQLMDMPQERAVSLVRQAALEAVDRGAQVVGLGAYTSIVTANGDLLGDVGALVTTGNAFTVSSAVDALTRLGATRCDVGRTGCAVVGAAGNIGRATSLLLAEQAGSLVLVGNPAHPARTHTRLENLALDVVVHLRARGTSPEAGDLARAVIEVNAGWSDRRVLEELRQRELIVLETDLRASMARSPLVVVATSSPGLAVTPDLPIRGAVVCDVSQPPNVGPNVAEQRPDVTVVAGGLVRLPGHADLGVDFGLPPGVTYACTAETLVAAARLHDPVLSRGDRLDLDAVRLVGRQAREMGFALHLEHQAVDR